MTEFAGTTPPTWVTAFFGNGNALTWSDILNRRAPNGWGPEVLAWLAVLERDENGVALLPYLGEDGTVVWYGVAQSERAGRELGEDIAGFIGASYGGFDGRTHVPDSADAPGLLLAASLPWPLYRVAPGRRWLTSVRRAVEIYRSLLERKPSARVLAARSVGALRSRFDRALLVGNEEEATRLYEEVLSTGRLSLENRLYLRVRLLAGLGRWTELAADTRLLRSLADLALPPRVRAELLDSLYRTHIDRLENPLDVSTAVDEFRLKIAPFGRLFSMRQNLRAPRVTKAFLMHALLRPKHDRQELEELKAILPMTAADAPFSSALRAFADSCTPAPTPSPDKAAGADEAFDDLEYENALRLYAMADPHTRKSVSRVIQCAQMIGTADATRTALGVLAASQVTEAQLPQTVRTVIESLRQFIAPDVVNGSPVAGAAPAAEPKTWHDWANWVATGAPEAQTCKVLDERSADWPVETYLQRDAAVTLARALEDAALVAPEIIQSAFAHLYQAFVGDREETQAQLAPVYRALLSAIVLAPSRSCDDLELARTLAALLLESGVSEPAYRLILRELTDLIRRDSSVNTMDWALDLAEAVATNRAAFPPDQMNLVVAVLECAKSRIHRLSKRQIEIVRTLCADMGIAVDQYISGASDEDPDEQAISALGARSIAIYTLAETAGQRALQILSKLVPEIDVALNSDKVCTNQLATLARNAELFVFAWRSSKHAAFYCIKDHRPKDKRILMPSGKGTASIVRALLEA